MSILGARRVPHNAVRRERLNLARHPLVILRAPMGAGKTLALAEWAADQPADTINGVWLTADLDTADRVALWRAIGEALLATELLDPRGSAAEAFRNLSSAATLRRELDRGFMGFREDITIVIDAFERITDPNAIDDVHWILQHHSAVRFILSGRDVPLPERMRIELEPYELTTEDLLMTRADIEKMLTLDEASHVAQWALRILELSGGNALASRAAVIELKTIGHEASPSALRDDLSVRFTRLLREELSRRYDISGLYEFAVTTSIVESLTVDLANELSRRDDAARLLRILESEGLGTWAPGPSGDLFSYTPAVRARLMNELSDEQEINRLCLIAADRSAHDGNIMTAMQLAVKAGDLARASSYAMRPWIFFATPTHALIEVMASVPTRKLRQHPLLLALLALSYNASKTHRLKALEAFTLAAVALRSKAATIDPAHRLFLLGAESGMLRASGRFKAAVTAAHSAVRQFREITATQSTEFDDAGALALTQSSLSLYYGGDPRGAIELASLTFLEAPRSGVLQTAHALAQLAGFHALAGEYTQARQYLESLEELPSTHGWRDGYLGAMANVAQALLALDDFDFVSAESSLNALAPHLPTLEHWAIIARVQALVHLGTGEAAGGITALTREIHDRPHSRSSAHVMRSLALAHANLLLAGGRMNQAQALLKRLPPSEPDVGIVLARQALVSDKSERVLALLAALSQPDIDAVHRVEAALLSAAALRRLERRAGAMAALQQFADLVAMGAPRASLMLIPAGDLGALAEVAGGQARFAEMVGLSDFGQIPSVMTTGIRSVGLTSREIVVLQALASGGTLNEVSASLHVSTNTIKSQLRSVYRKLGVSTRDEALAQASAHGLLEA